MLFWGLIIAVSVGLLAVSAGAAGHDAMMGTVHLAIAAVVSLALGLLAVRDIRARVQAHDPPAAIAATSARFMGLVWAWGALALVVTYATGILSWKEWWQFFLAFFVAAGLCLFFSALLNKDAASGGQDDTILRIGRILAYVQFFGMLAVMIGLVLDGKFPGNFEARTGWEDWAANHVFFFGALALAAISAYAIRVQGGSGAEAAP